MPEGRAINRRSLVLLAFLAFVSLGLPDAVLGVSWKAIRSDFGAPLENLGWILLGGTSAYLVSSFFAGQLMRWMGVGRLLAVSCGLVTLSLVGFAMSPGLAWLILAASAGGLGAGAIDSGLNAYAAANFSPRVMNWLHACWGVGATTGPALMTAVLALNISWRAGYWVLAAILGVLTVQFVLTRRAWGNVSSGSGIETPSAGIFAALGASRVWLNVAVFFVYCGIESSAGQLFFTLLTEGRGMSVGAAGATVAGYWAALTLGRILFGQWTASAGEAAVLWVAMIGSIVAAMLIWWHPASWVGIAGVVGLGFLLSPIFPTYMSMTPGRVGAHLAGHAVGFQVAAASAGIMVFPWLVTLGARQWGLEVVSMYLLIASVVLAGLHCLGRMGEVRCHLNLNTVSLLGALPGL